MKYIMTLDQGTTSSRAILFNKRGQIKGTARKEFRQIFPKPGWVEHDPMEIWRSQLGVMRKVLKDAGATAADIAAIGITNQRETTVVWDRETGKPIHNAIVWQDRRTAAHCDQLRSAGKAKPIRKRTGLVLDAYFSGTKVAWILENVKGARKLAEAGRLAFGTIDSWLVWQLTGGTHHITDLSNASRTLLCNIHKGDWDPKLLNLLNVPASMLPKICGSSEVYGETEKLILGAPVPISGIAGDQQAALFGQACFRKGMVKNTYGTGCFMLMNTGKEAVASKNNLLTTVAWKIGDQIEYALEGSVFIAGALVQWIRDGLGLIESAADIEKLARKVRGSDGVVVVPAFVGLGAPHWDQYARGTIIGLTRGSNASHIARAALESIAHQSIDVVAAMEADSGIKLKEMRVDGGATANNLLMQIQADLLRRKVIRPRVLETTALGAAYLAGLAVGFWKNKQEIAGQWKAAGQFEGNMSTADVKASRALWSRGLERSKGWDAK